MQKVSTPPYVYQRNQNGLSQINLSDESEFSQNSEIEYDHPCPLQQMTTEVSQNDKNVISDQQEEYSPKKGLYNHILIHKEEENLQNYTIFIDHQHGLYQFISQNDQKFIQKAYCYDSSMSKQKETTIALKKPQQKCLLSYFLKLCQAKPIKHDFRELQKDLIFLKKRSSQIIEVNFKQSYSAEKKQHSTGSNNSNVNGNQGTTKGNNTQQNNSQPIQIQPISSGNQTYLKLFLRKLPQQNKDKYFMILKKNKKKKRINHWLDEPYLQIFNDPRKIKQIQSLMNENVIKKSEFHKISLDKLDKSTEDQSKSLESSISQLQQQNQNIQQILTKKQIILNKKLKQIGQIESLIPDYKTKDQKKQIKYQSFLQECFLQQNNPQGIEFKQQNEIQQQQFKQQNKIQQLQSKQQNEIQQSQSNSIQINQYYFQLKQQSKKIKSQIQQLKNKIQNIKKIKQQRLIIIQQYKNISSNSIPTFKSVLFEETFQIFTTYEITLYTFFAFNETFKLNQKYFENEQSYKASKFLELITQLEQNKFKKNKDNLINYKDSQGLKKQFQNQEFVFKLGYKISHIFHHSYYRFNAKTYELQRKSIEDKQKVSLPDQSSLLQLKVSVYNLSYVVFFCLNKLRSQTYKKTKKKYIEELTKKLIESNFQQNNVGENKEISSKLDYQTYYMLFLFIKTLCYKIIEIDPLYNYKRKIIAQTYLINFLQHFYLYNYVINSYQFINKKSVNFKQYEILILDQQIRKQLQNNYNGDKSFSQIKVQIFWQTFEYKKQSSLLKRIFLDSFVNDQEKIINLYSQNISMYLIYAKIYPIVRETNLIDIQIKYITHFMQYSHEIVAELSQAKNISLDSVFNSIRFILINLILHFTQLCIKKIQKDIQKCGGRIHKKLLLERRSKNNKWNDSHQKGKKAMNLAYQKIIRYIELTKDKKQIQNSSNVLKLKIFIDQKKQLMGFLIGLNLIITNNKNLDSLKSLLNQQSIKKIQHVFKGKHPQDPLFRMIIKYYNLLSMAKSYQQCTTYQQLEKIQQRPLTIYKYILQIYGKQYQSTKVMQKTWKKLLKKHFGQSFIKLYPMQQYSTDLNQLYNRQSTKNQKNFDKKFNQFQKQWVIVILQNIKLYTMITTISLYSFQIEKQNQRIRFGKQQNNTNIRRTQPKYLSEIFKILDMFYIFRSQRLNTISLQNKSVQQLQQILKKYIKYSRPISLFFQQKYCDDNQYFINKDFNLFQQIQITQPVQLDSIKKYINPHTIPLILFNSELLETNEKYKKQSEKIQKTPQTQQIENQDQQTSQRKKIGKTKYYERIEEKSQQQEMQQSQSQQQQRQQNYGKLQQTFTFSNSTFSGITELNMNELSATRCMQFQPSYMIDNSIQFQQSTSPQIQRLLQSAKPQSKQKYNLIKLQKIRQMGQGYFQIFDNKITHQIYQSIQNILFNNKLFNINMDLKCLDKWDNIEIKRLEIKIEPEKEKISQNVKLQKKSYPQSQSQKQILGNKNKHQKLSQQFKFSK